MGYLPKKTEAGAGNQSATFLSNTISNLYKLDLVHTIQVIAACIIGLFLTVGSIYYFNYRNTGYAVKYDGKIIGYVKSKESAINAFNAAKEEIMSYDKSINISNNIEFEKLLVNKDVLINNDDLKDMLKTNLYLQYTSYAIVVNGKDVAVVKNKEEADKVIQEVKKHFEQKEKENGANEVISVTIKDDIKTEKRVTDISKIVDAKTAIDILISEKGITKQYVVKQGDTIWNIAKDNGIGVEEIANLNSGINLDKLKIGQTINLSFSQPFLNVETVEKVVTDEDIPYDTKYVTDNDLYKGQSKVVENGQYGINRVIKQITKFNGKEIASTVLSTLVVKSPVTRILAKGVKDLVGTGKFMWPLGGRISSSFGYRGREYHQGLDIAAPIGSPIYAADSGTVVQSGYEGGYGKLVIIDHGNGYCTYYGHCGSLLVKVGDSVSRGQQIAAVGMTGQTTGPHCHFEVRLNGRPQNPLNYLK